MRARQPYPSAPPTPGIPTVTLPQSYPFLSIASVATALGIMSACPARALPPLPPLLFPVHLYDQSLIAVLMMNHSNFTGFKTKTRLLWFHGVALLSLSLTLWVSGGRVGYSLCLAVVAVLLASESFPCPHKPSYSLSAFPLLPSPCSTWKLHGPLCVCVHVCACIYMYRERYINRGQGEAGRGWSEAQGLQPGHCPLEPVICPFHVGEIKGRR